MKIKEIVFIVEEDLCHFDKDEEVPNIVRLHIVKEETFAYA